MDQQLVRGPISFLTPYFSQGRGNATTAKRIVTGLQDLEINTNIISYDETPFSSKLVASIKESQLLHVLHFRRFSDWLENNDYILTKPFIITSGGTDVNIDIFTEEHQEKIGRLLRQAKAITVFSEDAQQKLVRVYPDLQDIIYIINQSVWFPSEVIPLQTNFLGNDSGPNILLPAGLREVKDVLFVLPALLNLKKQFPQLTFTILGAPLEAKVLKTVQVAQSHYPWIEYLEEVDLHEMPAIYQKSDIVINTSLEEGQSSALLEAMYLGKPVLARNNGGNRSIISNGETGFLFHSVEEFQTQLEQLWTNKKLMTEITSKGQSYVKTRHSLKEEIESYLELYKRIIK